MERNRINEERFDELKEYKRRDGGNDSGDIEDIYSDYSVDILEEEDVLTTSDIAFMRGYNEQ